MPPASSLSMSPRSIVAQHTDTSGVFAYDKKLNELAVQHFFPEWAHDNWVQASLTVEGKNLQSAQQVIAAGSAAVSVQLKVKYVAPPVHESVVIQADSLDPTIDRRNDAIYQNSLFGRDDQLVQTLSAGINVGQHEGGGKSLEVRRFGFNLDHGGVNGGLKFLVDDVQQNQPSQGHGQGYLGQLKSLTPELVEDVDILNGPFSALYGDFSLGLSTTELPATFRAWASCTYV